MLSTGSLGKRAYGGAAYLSTPYTGCKVDLFYKDDASGRQRWILSQTDSGWYNIKVVDGVCGRRKAPSCHARAMFLPCSCHALAMFLPCSCHALAMLLPCCCHVLAMFLPCSCHALAMLSPCSCHVVPMPCCCHSLAMLLPCSCHALAMLLPCCCHVRSQESGQ